MTQDIDFESIDALFNMRSRFWEASRERALSEKKMAQALTPKLEERIELKRKDREQASTRRESARAVGGS